MRSKGRSRRNQTTSVEPVRRPRVFALACPVNPKHVATRVYRTDGETRYCVCDDCGATWKQIGPAAGEDELDEAPRDPAPGESAAVGEGDLTDE